MEAKGLTKMDIRFNYRGILIKKSESGRIETSNNEFKVEFS